MTIYHGGTVESDRYGYVEFLDMQSVSVLFNDRPSFSEMVARVREELHCFGDDDIAVDGVLHLGCPPNIFRRMISIGCADQWDNYVRSAMKSQLQCLDVVVRRVLVDPIPHGFTPAMDHPAHIDPPIPEPYLHVQIAPTVPDAQSAPNALFGDGCHTHVFVADPPYEIPLTQNHPSKCLNRMVFGSSSESWYFFHSFLISVMTLQETFLRISMCPMLLRKCTFQMDFVAPIMLKL